MIIGTFLLRQCFLLLFFSASPLSPSLPLMSFLMIINLEKVVSPERSY